MTAIALTRPAFEFDGVVRLTSIGTTFVIFTIVIGFAAINTGNNSLYIGLAFMLACLLLSGIASKGGLKHLALELGGIDEAWAGRGAEGRLRIANRSPIWNVRDVIITSEDLEQPIFVAIVQRRSDVLVPARFLFRKRGVVQLKTLDLYTRYPFGFFLKKRRVRISGEIIVFPRLLDEDQGRERFRPVEGELHPAGRLGAGTDVHSFREYVRGDSLRHVAWKKSASLGRWIMKQTELEAGRAVQVVVDPYRPRGVSEEQFEGMISAAATFIYDALRRDLDVVLSLPRILMRAQGAERATPIFRALALLEATHEPVAQSIDRNAIVFSVGIADERETA